MHRGQASLKQVNQASPQNNECKPFDVKNLFHPSIAPSLTACLLLKSHSTKDSAPIAGE